jgi:hypothetical protein
MLLLVYFTDDKKIFAAFSIIESISRIVLRETMPLSICANCASVKLRKPSLRRKTPKTFYTIYMALLVYILLAIINSKVLLISYIH